MVLGEQEWLSGFHGFAAVPMRANGRSRPTQLAELSVALGLRSHPRLIRLQVAFRILFYLPLSCQVLRN